MDIKAAAVGALLLCALPVYGQEAWCTANPSNCVMSETLQDTSYSTVSSGSNYWMGLSSSTKPGLLTQPASGIASISCGSGNCTGTFASVFSISTDSSILNLLPNRNPSLMARFLRIGDGEATAVRIGYSPISLGNARRISMRWYAYYTPTYSFAAQPPGTYPTGCKNGKFAHVNAGNGQWGGGGQGLLTFQSWGSGTNTYSIINAGGWQYPGHSIDFFTAGSGPFVDSVSLNDWKGKWTRQEITIRRPRYADFLTGDEGIDYEWRVKDVTNDGPNLVAERFSQGCGAQPYCGWLDGSPNSLVWNKDITPLGDMSSMHTEFYRESGTCAGWSGWAYVAIAKWDTDAGQLIGAASEVEGGGGGGPSPPVNLRIVASIGWLVVGAIVLLSILCIGGFHAYRLKGTVSRYRARTGADLGAASTDNVRG